MTRLDSWDVGPAPPTLADGVMARVERLERQRRARRALAAFAVAALASAATVVAAVTHGRGAPGGDVVATERMEIEIAPGVLAVMERAAHLVWRGREVSQDRGEVSYWVRAGAALELVTPTGQVRGGASTSRVLVEPASTYVLVRDGEVSVIGGAGRVALGAGRYARVSAASLTVDHDDVDGSVGRALGVAPRLVPSRAPVVEPAPPSVASARIAPPPHRAARAPAASSPAPVTPPSPTRRAPIVPPCFCSPMQAVCDCGGG